MIDDKRRFIVQRYVVRYDSDMTVNPFVGMRVSSSNFRDCRDWLEQAWVYKFAC